MGEVLKKFGRYFLLDQIAQGGMAEIYVSRLAALDGAGRLLVIKRIQAGYGTNNEFLQMFKSEIKVTMGFNHPNIVQLYDFGEEQSQPYIAMEFVDGKNLRQFLSRFSEIKQTFPVDLAAFIMEQAASGLNYAHGFRDKISGEPLNIVHRDISPQNILISYEGNIKVIDFGIAKASTNIESTRAGVIKGKPSYLSPEQITGETLDGRCDIFALGIVLWELLTGRKLFAGENDLAVLKLIESCNSHVKPPSTINPKVPKELDYIVLKALAKQREKRFQNAEDMQRALHKFIYTFSPDFNPSDLSYYAKDLFKSEIVEERKHILKLNDKAEQLLRIERSPVLADSSIVMGRQGSRKEDTTTVVEIKPRNQVSVDAASSRNVRLDLDPVAGLKSRQPRPQPGFQSTRNAPSPSPRARNATSSRSNIPEQRLSASAKKSSGKTVAVLMAIASFAGVAVYGPDYFGIRRERRAELILEGQGKEVRVMINGELKANRLPATITDFPVGTPVTVSVTGQGTGTFQQLVTVRKNEKKVINVGSSWDLAPGAKTVQLRLNIIPSGPGTVVSINGKSLDANAPNVMLALDAPHELSAERPGYKPLTRQFTINSRDVSAGGAWPMDVQLEPERYGYLSLRTTPSADTILVNGQKWTHGTPLDNEKFAAGTYTIRLVNEVLGMEKTLKISVQEGKAISLDERLEIRN